MKRFECLRFLVIEYALKFKNEIINCKHCCLNWCKQSVYNILRARAKVKCSRLLC